MSFDFKTFKEQFDREAVKLMREQSVPGLSVLITKENEVIYDRSFGSREWQGGKPANSDTIYGIASMTKSITCVAILQLQEQGKLNINDPISKYIPVTIGFPNQPITIHHLMCHASGIPSLHDYVFPILNEELFESNQPKFPMGNWDDFYFHINDAKDEVISKPGEKFYYFNGGFTLLSQIVAKVSGIKYEDYVKQNILIPLQMFRSTFSREDLEKDSNASKGYDSKQVDKKLKRSPKPHLVGPFNSGAGGLNSTVKELTNYLQFHLNEGNVDGKQLLSKESILEMRKPHNKNLKTDSFLLNNSQRAYGYGLSVYENYHGYTLISHSGASGVSGGVIGFIPELKLTFAMLYNVGWMSLHLMDLALVLLMGKSPDDEIPFFKRRKHINRIIGIYEGYKKVITATIKYENNMLVLETIDITKETLPLIPKDITDPECMNFYVFMPYGIMDVDFRRDINDNIIFEFERNLMHKVAVTNEKNLDN